MINPLLGDKIEHQDVLNTFQDILEIVNSCENIGADYVKDGKIENAADYLMDVQILKMSHDLMGSTAERMGNSEFNDEEYVASLQNFFTTLTGETDYGKLSGLAIKCCNASQFSVSMLGTFDLTAPPRPEKIRKEVQRSRRSTGPAKAPENIKNLTKSTSGAEKINITRNAIQKLCRARKTDKLPYFELICNPEDFMKSVDIAFQISFLVRDGFLGLKKIDDEPYVFLYDPDPATKRTQRAHESDTVQCVMTLTHKLWKEKVEKFKIQKALLNINQQEVEAEGLESDSD